MRVHVAVINLERATRKRRHMEEQLRGVPVEWIDAVDGGALDARTLERLTRRRRRRLHPGEVGCFLSHMAAMRAASLLAPGEWLLVLEDDAVLTPNWAAELQRAIAEIPPGGGLLLCGDDTPDRFYEEIGEDVRDQFAAVREDAPHSEHCVRAGPRLNTHAYAIDASTARRILDSIGEIETAVDVQMHFDRVRYDRYALVRGIARQDKRFGSSVQASPCALLLFAATLWATLT